jgi:beta-lactamase regulating signal transducer with metallopeptidase domain/polyhydroxyalkanoate synthesis regulator phasin
VIDHLFAVGVSNACFALVLAAIAMVVSAKTKRPHLAYMLWLLVFIKLVTPAVVTIPITEFSTATDQVAISDNVSSLQLASELNVSAENNESFASSALQARTQSQTEQSSFVLQVESALALAQPYLIMMWLAGSVIVFAFSLYRVFQFNRILSESTEIAPLSLQAEAREIGLWLGMKTVPAIFTTDAQVSPMVWWIGGKVHVIVPKSLLAQLTAKQSHFVLAHELAHVRRKDYLVRWLEWLVCVCFWWNPIAWWGRRNLRAMEEICCDALVLDSLKPQPHTYASALLKAVECLTQPAFRPPAVASEINSGGFLERRFKMIVSKNPIGSNLSWMQACIVILALAVLPLGVVYAADIEAVQRRLGESVAEGDLSLREAADMLDLLRDRDDDVEHEDEHDDDEDRYRQTDEQAKHRIGQWIETERHGLKAALEAGKLSEKEAHGKWQHFTEKELGPKLKAMVDEDHISEELAMGIWNHVTGEKRKDKEHGQSRHKPAHDRDEPNWESIKHRIEGAVKRGDMSREEANRTYERIKHEHDRRNKHSERGDDLPARAREHLMHVRKEIEHAVAEGRISREQARKKMEGAVRDIEEHLHRAREEREHEDHEERERHDLERERDELNRESGELERERRELERERGEQDRERGNRDRDRGNDREHREHREERERQAKHDQPDWESIKRRIEGAVKSGKMSREEANKVYEGIKKRMAASRNHEGNRDRRHESKDGEDDTRRKIEGVGRRIKEAVQAGKLTEEQGRERMEEYLKSLRLERD